MNLERTKWTLLRTRKVLLTAAITAGLAATMTADLALLDAHDAQAIIGRPLTPRSVAGVARRTTRRTVARAATMPYGAVAALPAGCSPYYPCAGATYQPYYYGANVVYAPY